MLYEHIYRFNCAMNNELPHEQRTSYYYYCYYFIIGLRESIISVLTTLSAMRYESVLYFTINWTDFVPRLNEWQSAKPVSKCQTFWIQIWTMSTLFGIFWIRLYVCLEKKYNEKLNLPSIGILIQCPNWTGSVKWWFDIYGDQFPNVRSLRCTFDVSFSFLLNWNIIVSVIFLPKRIHNS